MLDKGKPDDIMPAIKGAKVREKPAMEGWGVHSLTRQPTMAVLLPPQERLPTVPLSGMFNKSGGKVRLTFKLEQDQLWIGTKGRLQPREPSLWKLWGDSCLFLFSSSTERTEKVPMGSIKNVVSEPIEGHEDYHMMVTVQPQFRTGLLLW